MIWATATASIHIPAGPEVPLPKDNLYAHLPEFVGGVREFARAQGQTLRPDPQPLLAVGRGGAQPARGVGRAVRADVPHAGPDEEPGGADARRARERAAHPRRDRAARAGRPHHRRHARPSRRSCSGSTTPTCDAATRRSSRRAWTPRRFYPRPGGEAQGAHRRATPTRSCCCSSGASSRSKASIRCSARWRCCSSAGVCKCEPLCLLHHRRRPGGEPKPSRTRRWSA